MAKNEVSSPPTVVLHASDKPGDVQRALSSAARLLQIRPKLFVRIIVNAAAVNGLVGEEALDLSAQTEVFACENALRGNDIRHDALRPGTQTVPAGVVAIAEAQLEGASYVRL